VVPCFNEAARIDPSAFVAMTSVPNVSVLFVDDGSTDGTVQLLENATRGVGSVSVLRLEQNRGKGEAVRAGMLNATERGAEVVGYLDADGATPPDEWLRLVNVLETSPGVDAVLGSRVAMLGYDIRRRMARHYSGRVFATLAAVALGRPVYDTQCGAKVFLVTPRLLAALSEPFRTRWVFDVEMLQRLLTPQSALQPSPPAAVIEEPLRSWVDRPGSSLSLRGAMRSAVDVGGLIVARSRVP
jgi:glycosyltransferase involved in cell wall biosynthesis